LSSEPISTISQREAAVRIERVPFVREDQRLRPRGQRELAGRRADIEAFDDDCVALSTDDGFGAEFAPQRRGVFDLSAAEHPLVARGERLCDRRRRPDHVDDDADAGRGFLCRSEGDINAHADTLARWTLHATATATRTGRPVSPARSADARSVTSA
jgi:hypothetical protein